MKLTHRPLTAGDIRQKGDEWQHSNGGPKANVYKTTAHNSTRGPSKWSPVTSIFEQAILASDLVHLNFRRPVNE